MNNEPLALSDSFINLMIRSSVSSSIGRLAAHDLIYTDIAACSVCQVADSGNSTTSAGIIRK